MAKQIGRMGDKRGGIFHIIHGSFVDGYGIRTTVFLKGCPLAMFCLLALSIQLKSMLSLVIPLSFVAQGQLA